MMAALGTSPPIAGAKSDVADADYLHYGFWLKRTTDEDGVLTYNEVETFAGSSIARAVALIEVEGTAEYNGGATGVYVKNVYNPDRTIASATSGFFTANANLMAYFGGDDVKPSHRPGHRHRNHRQLRLAAWRGEQLVGGFEGRHHPTLAPSTNGTANGGGARIVQRHLPWVRRSHDDGRP